MSNKIDDDKLNLLIHMISDISKFKIRLKEMEENVSEINETLKSQMTATDDFILEMEQALQGIKKTYVELGWLDAQLLDDDDE
jgi:hypothetical protein|tara:strand:- start:310 stop:558 length:249 start_codon:yes stop_codon:yes gene_type:complete